MNSKLLFSISIIAAGLIWTGGHAMASDSGKGMTPGGGVSSGSTNSGVFSGVPDPDSPGGTKDVGKGSGGDTESGKVRQGGVPGSGRNEPSGSSAGKPSATASSSDSSSSGGASGSTSNRRDSGKASDDMKADQGGQSQDDPGGDKQVNTGMKKGQ